MGRLVMKKKRSGITWNKKKQNKNIILIVIASIAATVAAAVVGILKYKGRKCADIDVTGKGETEVSKPLITLRLSNALKKADMPPEADTMPETAPAKSEDASREQIISHIKHRKINPGELDWESLAKEKEMEQIRKGDIPEYMLDNTDQKPVRGAKRKRWKKAVSGIAMILAVAVVVCPVVQHLRPAEAMAKESFAGIGKIVEEHGEDNPYRILNIVPSEVYCDAPAGSGGGTGSGSTTNPDGSQIQTSFSFATGSIGYLTGGKAPFADDLAEAYKSNPVFRHYASREDFLNLLVPESTFSSFPGVQYKEAYLGVHSVSEADGWTLLFPNLEVAVDDAYQITSTVTKGEMSEGNIRGTAVKYVDGEDKTGFDFVFSDGTIRSNHTIPGLSSRFVYILNDSGDTYNWYPVSLDMYYENYMPYDIPAWVLKEDGAKAITVGEQGPDCSADAYVYKYNSDGSYAPVDIARNVPELYMPPTQQPEQDNTADANINNGTDGTTPEQPGGSGENNGDAGTTDDAQNDNVTGTEPTDPGTTDPIPTDPIPTDPGTMEPTPEDSSTSESTSTEETQSTSTSSESIQATEAVGVVSADLPDITQNTIFNGRWYRLVEDGGVTPNPDPTPTPNPDPNPTPSPDPNPTPSPDPNPTPNPDPNPTPSPDPNPTPSPDPNPTPNPDPNPTPSPDPNPTPEPDPNPTPEPDLNPTPEQPGTPEEVTPPVDAATSGGVQSEVYFILDFDSFDAVDGANLLDMLGDDALEEGSAADEAMIEAEDGISLFASSTPQNYDAAFIYVGPGMGNYKLTDTGDENDMLIGVYNAPLYFRCRTSNDWLKQYVFSSLVGGDNANNAFQIEVQTVRADQVDTEMVNAADLIYLESGQNMFLNPSLSVRYIQHGDAGSALEDINDMNAGVVSEILSRAADDLVPVIVDYAIAEETDTDKYAGTNYQLLAQALLKRDLAGYFEAVNIGSDLMANLEMTINADEYANKDDNDYNYVNQNIYVINNEVLVSDDFAAFFDDFKAKAGFSDVLAAIEAENTTLAENDRISYGVSKARAIQYIINFSVGIMGEFDDLTILELQPTANIDLTSGGIVSDLHTEMDSKGNTKLVWKTDAMKTGKQILYSKKEFGIRTNVKSVVEFNGEWEDVNGIYDMIFIGLDGQNLNLGDRHPRQTVYNDASLNGKVYHLGDAAGDSRYDSNDITAQKMMDLLEYLRAGYPIVVENDFFTDKTARGASSDTINTKYVAEGTVMYNFLSAAVSGEDYKDSIFTVSDTMSNAGFMARMKTSKPRIVLSDEDAGDDSGTGQQVGMVQRLVLDENNEYHGRIAFQIKNNRGEDYYGDTTMHLYADMNYDGIFGVEEELGEEFGAYVNEGNVIDVTINGMGPGVIPWKLEVTDTGNAYRRASVQGYFELVTAYEEEIRVLQVTKSKGNFYIDLEAMYKKKDDSVLARLLKDAESNSNIAFEFETVTPDELADNLGKNPKYLNQWDIVVLTVDDGVAVDSAAFTNYINEGRSLLVCSQNKSGNSAGLTPETLGWSSGRTFVSLGAANQYHRYAGLNSGMYEPGRAGMRADKINEGSILYYPYEMTGSSFAFAEKMAENGTGLRASEYLLNFENNLKSEQTATYVTTWLTFGGNRDTAYGISPKDARNNYYCYSKGNVVYLAQSEYPYIFGEGELAAAAMGADECKFFVNALMAAYSAGVHGSDVSIVSGFAQNSAPMKSIAVPFDQEWRDTADDNTEGILDNTVDVYFKFADSNIGANKKVTVSFFYEDAAGSQEFAIGDKTVKANPFGSEIWTVTDNKLVPVQGDAQNPDQIGVLPGKVYRIKAPVVSLRTLTDDKTNNAGIFVLVESEFIRNGKTYKMEGLGTVSLNRARLFLLE